MISRFINMLLVWGHLLVISLLLDMYFIIFYTIDTILYQRFFILFVSFSLLFLSFLLHAERHAAFLFWDVFRLFFSSMFMSFLPLFCLIWCCLARLLPFFRFLHYAKMLLGSRQRTVFFRCRFAASPSFICDACRIWGPMMVELLRHWKKWMSCRFALIFLLSCLFRAASPYKRLPPYTPHAATFAATLMPFSMPRKHVDCLLRRRLSLYAAEMQHARRLPPRRYFIFHTKQPVPLPASFADSTAAAVPCCRKKRLRFSWCLLFCGAVAAAALLPD